MKRLINFWNHYFKYQRVLIEIKEYKKFSKSMKKQVDNSWYSYFFGSPVP